MKFRVGGKQSTLFKQCLQAKRAEQNRYLERLQKKTLGEQPPSKATAQNASKTA